MRLHNVRLLVSDFDGMYAFYKDTLGLDVAWGKPGDVYAEFTFPEGGTLALFRRDLMAGAVGAAALPPAPAAQDRFGLVVFVASVDGVCESLKAKGVTLVTEPVDRTDWGIRVAHFRDPDGNLIELASALARA